MQKKIITVLGLFVCTSVMAGKMYKAPTHEPIGNSNTWQSTQQAIKNAQQQINSNTIDIQQTISQQSTQIEQSINSAMTGAPAPKTTPITQSITKPTATNVEKETPETNDTTAQQPAAPAPTGLPSNDTQDTENSGSSGWNYGF